MEELQGTIKRRASILDEPQYNPLDMLELVVEKDDEKQLRKMRYKQTKDERNQLRDDFFAETLKRLAECCKNNFDATFGDEQMKRKPEYNLNYCTGPAKDLFNQYNKLVDDAQYEVNNAHQMADSKKLDIAKLMIENNKFLATAGEKRSWKQYEKTLAIERVMNDRLLNSLVRDRKIDELIDEGKGSLYDGFVTDNEGKIEIDRSEIEAH